MTAPYKRNRLAGGFTQMPNILVRGGHRPTHIAVLLVIVSRGECFASAKTIGKEAGCSEKSVRRAFQYWAVFGKNNPWFVWTQRKQKAHSTYLITVEFPSFIAPAKGTMSTNPSVTVTEKYGQEYRENWSGSPTKNNPEEKPSKNETGIEIDTEDRNRAGLVPEEDVRKETELGKDYVRRFQERREPRPPPV
jgi:hypothetical protein